jgi:sulfoxide reductase catalytic subunit YedY
MLIRNHQDGFIHPLSSEITSPEVYANRRQLLRQWSAGAAAMGLGSWAQREAWAQGGAAAPLSALSALPANQSTVQGAMSVEKLTSQKDATSYNNFYEFGVDKIVVMSILGCSQEEANSIIEANSVNGASVLVSRELLN